MNTSLKSIFNQFKVDSEFDSYVELNSGHINDTYLIKTQNSPNYILQRVNGNVFKDAAALITNKVLVSNFLQNQLRALPLAEIQRRVLSFVAVKNEDFFFKDTEENFWNMTVFIEDSVTYEKTPNSLIAFEAGKATGNFLALTSKFDVAKLTTVLPDFHSVKTRFLQFKTALSNASESRKEKGKELISFVNANIEEMFQLDNALEQNILPLKVTHNDTKISNILFSQEDKSLCLIDTDTVMEGLIHFDYGDAIRTICNTSDEDCSDIEAIDFNLEYFKNYTNGFFQEIRASITKEEIEYLPISIKILPFIMGLRFLTDFLNDDVYYKTNYSHHNFDRAQNQFTLVEKINTNYLEIKTFIKSKI